jgi:hypothetical protein
VSVLADVSGSAELAEDRLDARIGAGITADHDGERARSHLRDAARHGSIEHRRAEPADLLGELAAGARADRAEVDPHLPPPETGEDPVRPRGHLLQYPVVGEGGEDDL